MTASSTRILHPDAVRARGDEAAESDGANVVLNDLQQATRDERGNFKRKRKVYNTINMRSAYVVALANKQIQTDIMSYETPKSTHAHPAT